MPKFAVKAGLEVDAVQWNGPGDTPAVKSLLGDDANDNMSALRVKQSEGGWGDVPRGVWVVRYADGGARLWTDGTFRRVFDPAPPEPQWETVYGNQSGVPHRAFRWDGEAHTANRLLGERYRIDWEYKRVGSSAILVHGSTAQVGDWFVHVASNPANCSTVMTDAVYKKLFTLNPPTGGECKPEKPVVAVGIDGQWVSSEPPVLLPDGYKVEGVWLSNAQLYALTAAAGPGKVVEYDIVSGPDAAKVAAFVSGRLSHGWEPQGGVTWVDGVWVQAMIRRQTRAGTGEQVTRVTDDVEAGLSVAEVKEREPTDYSFNVAGRWKQRNADGTWQDIPPGPKPDKRTEFGKLVEWLEAMKGPTGGNWVYAWETQQKAGVPTSVKIRLSPEVGDRAVVARRVLEGTAKVMFPHFTFTFGQ